MSGISVGNGLSKGVGLSVGSGFSRGGGLYFSGFSVAPTLNLNFTTMTALPSTITFSRPSNATYYDSTGKLTYAPNNLLLNSATLSTQNVTTAPVKYVLSFQGTGSVARTGTSTGTLTGTGVSDRVFVAFTPTAGTLTLTVVGSVTSAQLEAVTYQTTPSTYVATTTAAYYGPRLDYNPATLAPLGLLIEEARTNLALYSDQFNNAAWSRGFTTIAANTTTSPDGTTNADTLTATTANIIHNIYATQPITTTTAGYSLSLYMKKGTNRFVFVGQSGLTASNYVSAVFDLDGGGSSATQTAATGAFAILSTRQENVGNGWFRLTIVGSGQTSRYIQAGFASAATGNTFDTNGNPTFIATGAETIYIWGAQYELGSFATSYIPTAASSVARSADDASMTGANFSSWYNQTEGTFVPQYDVEGFTTNPGVFRASNAGATNYSQTRLTSTTSVGDVVVSSSQASFSFGGAIINALQKFALAYRVNDFAGTLNGATPLTDTSGSAPTDLDRLFLADVGSNVAPLNGHLASFVYYPSRLSDAQLQQLTLSAPPVGNALVWGDGNYLIWDTGNFLTWG